MFLAFTNPDLERRCVAGSVFDGLGRDEAEAAQDLLSVLAEASSLAELATFRSIRAEASDGALQISLQEVDMRTRPLSVAGKAVTVMDRSGLIDFADTTALVIDDITVEGHSLLRRAG